MKVSLCLMVYNELEGCRLTVPLISRRHFHEVFAVDGGSSDGTIEYLLSEGIDVRLQPVKGYNQAYHHAFHTSDADAIVFFHPKGTIDPNHTLLFSEFFNQGYDLVIASRMIRGAVNEEDSKIFRFRKWFVIFLGLVAGLLWYRRGAFIWDVLHGFRGMSRSAFQSMNPLSQGLSMDLEMVVRSYKLGFQRKEFAVQESIRPSGESHFKPFPTAVRLFRYMWFELWRKD